MRREPTVVAVLAAVVGVALAALLLPNAVHKLRAQGWFNPHAPGLLTTSPARPHARPRRPHARPSHARPGLRHAHSRPSRNSRHGLPRHGRPSRYSAPRPASHARPVSRRPTPVSHRPTRVSRQPAKQPGGLLPAKTVHAILKAGVKIAKGLGVLAVLLVILIAWRVARRSRRRYALYELHLSTHDQAKPQDVEDMVESIANIVRAWPAERLRGGQPYLALELICGHAPHSRSGREMQWSINVRCQPRDVAALDGAFSAAYPDVRVGRVHGQEPCPRAGALRRPEYVMRFRKERSFVYSLIADGEQDASAPLEQIARAQVAVSAPSIVRFQLTPTPSFFEALARRQYRRHEHKIARQEHWGLPDGGLQSTFNRAEMRAAERTQNRSLFWLEAVIAADTPEVCKTVAAAVQSRRGENRLHRRLMTVRQPLYRRRFARALGPLVPSTRCLVSAAEVAHLLALPSARMKGVPVKRMTLPRIPAPPGVTRGHHTRPSTTPRPTTTPEHSAGFPTARRRP